MFLVACKNFSTYYDCVLHQISSFLTARLTLAGCLAALLFSTAPCYGAPAAAPAVKADDSATPPAARADDFNWRDLVERTAVIAIENKTAKTQTLAVSLGDFGFLDGNDGAIVTNAAAGLAPIGGPAVAVKAGQTLRYQLTAAPPASLQIRPGKYTAILLLQETGKPPVVRPISATVPGAEPLTTDELTSRATRSSPFTSAWEANLSIPLSAPVSPQQAGLRKDAPIGVLKRESGPGYALVTWDPPASASPIALLPLKVSGIEEAGNYKGAINFPAGKSATVALVATDSVVYPILAIVLGIVTGSFLKRWINVGRAVRLYQRDVAALKGVFAQDQADFERLTAGKAYSAYSIAADFETKRKSLLNNVGILSLSAKPLDQSNADYQKALADLKSQREITDGWVVFASELDALRQAQESIGATGLTRPPGVTDLPAITGKATLLIGQVMTLDTYATVRANVQSARSLTGKWLSLANRYLSAAELHRNLAAILTGANQQTLAGVALDPIRLLLWRAQDDGGLARVETDLSRAEDLLEALRKTTTHPRVEAAGEPPTQAELGEEKPEAEGKRLELLVHLGDWLAFWIAVVAGVLTALSTYYFGKPFGALADYAAVFLWGMGSKAVVDLAALGLDKAVQTISRQAPAA
ncbi:MAG: hypothetical protein ABSC23_07120 [Bryobacteraceae bacterium]|jgi:hypothetical protein